MDISDKNFKPCPCGYQICQFCYNNIRQNPELNGRCPGCRRLYDDESVEYKTLSPDEYKMQQMRKEKREREKKQREKERKELEIASKKHLAGLRVVQKNLVYVTGLNPPCAPEDLHSVLRLDKYFGQYGKILKMVVNRKAPLPAANNSIVVYVTFARKEDALRCINELDGLLCDGRVLRAAHGTTKYCLLYLRGHPCPNPNCMFLHEPGEEADSYTRKDLSTHQGIKMGMRTSGGGHYPFGDDESEEGSPAHAPVLPATAHWAKSQAPASASASPLAPTVAVANPAAFPALSEIFKEQRLQKKDAKKSKGRARDGVVLPDDIDVDDHLAAVTAADTRERMLALADARQSLQVYFDDLGDGALPLFHYDATVDTSARAVLDDERVLARLLIERFLLRPIKKYHLAYANHPVSQQQQMLSQQAQMQTQAQSHAQAQAQAQAQVQVQAQAQTHIPQPQLQAQMAQMAQMSQIPQSQQPPLEDAQQLFLMQPQQNQGKAHPHLSAQLNALRMSDRARTATPPPPGLFSRPEVQSQPEPLSSSSQLLTQLMSGKK